MKLSSSSLRAFLRRLIDRARGVPIERDLGVYRPLLDAICGREDELRAAAPEALAALAADLAERAGGGEPADDLLVETFALVREAARRTLGMRPFDVQVIAGIAMHRGRLAEMQTGEGKTLAAVFPTCLNALSGKGVHVLTVNDYLARRDAGWMGPVYELLGLEVAFVQEGQPSATRRRAYGADVTYVTAREVGFGFLRDELAVEPSDLVLRPLHFALVDEADSILIDEARVPLVIAGSTSLPEIDLPRLRDLVRRLEPGVDYDTDEHRRNVFLTDSGMARAEAVLGDSLQEEEGLYRLAGLNLALHAAVLLRRDVDYIVRSGRIEMVDEHTGRVATGRRWPDGLQAALEAEEGLDPEPEGRVLGSITLQHFLRRYPRLCGMTATAQASAVELRELYGLTVVVIPPNRPSIRIDQPDLVFATAAARDTALIEEIRSHHAGGRPILVGTSSIEVSERLAAQLRRAGVACEVLNARNDALEAEIVAAAGTAGAVTISTNMAGRGTDIKLGGEDTREHQRIVARGGLYVLGTRRHESRRIDDQLRGRAGRQGDPGTSRFFLSLEDDLLRIFGDSAFATHVPEEGPLDDPTASEEIAHAQRVLEGEHLDIRKLLFKYSSLIEDQRRILARRRRGVLLGEESEGLLAAAAKERWLGLRQTVAERVLHRVERQLTLAHIDRCWCDHLAHVADVREAIELYSIANYDPFKEFNRLVVEAFGDLMQRIDAAVVESFLAAEVTADGIDPQTEGLSRPASTWTYLLTESPLGSLGERIARNVMGKGQTPVTRRHISP